MLVLIGLSLACFSTKAESLSKIQSLQEEYVIPLYTGTPPVVDSSSPRTPNQLPISCRLDGASSFLYFTFLFPMGDVTITLTEASAGVVSSDEYSTVSGLVSIPVPASGAYEITLVLESGAEYIGQFNY